MIIRRRSGNAVLLSLLVLAIAFNALAGPPDPGNGGIARTGVRAEATDLYFWGTYSYNVANGEALLKVDNIQNARATATKPLRIVLFLTKTSYPSGFRTAIYNIAPIAANTTIHNVNSGQIPWTNPGAGCWTVKFVLEEQVGSSWTMVQVEGFSNTWNIWGGCDPAPTISSIAPNHGPAAGGNSVQINGSSLGWTTSVKFAGTNATITDATSTAVTVTVPAHAAGQVTVALQTNSGSASSTYTYDTGFAVSGIEPDHGPDTGGTRVTITGTGLSGATSVTFGGVAAAINGNTATSIRVTTPAHAAGDVTVQINTPAGSATKSYRYDAEPVISSISPNHGPAAGGQTVTITGKNLGNASRVTFDNLQGTIISKTATSIVVTTPAHAPEQVTMTVRTPDGDDTATYTYDAPQSMQLLPVAGSLQGNFNSFFRTSMQMHNPTTAPMAGRLIFHGPGQGVAAEPSLSYSIAPGETSYIPDILPAVGVSGLGTLDLAPAEGSQAPLTLVRIFNDANEKGTTGMAIDFVPEGSVLHAGETGVLLAPATLNGFRFNIGTRALAAGAEVSITVRDATGQIRRSTTRTLAPNSYGLSAAADVVGSIEANDSIAFQVLSGACILYGSTTDNTTQDPSYQIARRVPIPTSDTAVVAVVGSLQGNLGSFFRTGFQLHNPMDSPISVQLAFHPAGQSAGAGDPSLEVTLAPGETRNYADLLPAMNTAGIGSLDVVPLQGALPVIVSRIFNDAGANGTAGMTFEAMRPADFLSAGDQSVLLGPADPANFRFNIGIRTMGEGTSMLFTQRDSSGAIVRTMDRAYPPSYFAQASAADIVGGPIGANDSITISINSGAAILYGAMTDNRTQDATTQIARRP